MGVKRDLSAHRFGKWTVIEQVGVNKYGMAKWRCRCDCSKEKVVLQGSLVAGTSASCGCGNNIRRIKHGYLVDGNYPKEYSCWRNMINRCYNPKHNSYIRYGGAGVVVCERWRHSFHNFISDMGKMPSAGHSIDRFPNKDGIYEPLNCRWATQIEQCSNLKKNVYTQFNGVKMTSAEFRRVTGIKSRWVTTLLKTKSGDYVYELYKSKNKTL